MTRQFTTPQGAPLDLQNGHPPARRRATRAERKAAAAWARVEQQRALDQIAQERLEAERERLKVGAEIDVERQRLRDQHDSHIRDKQEKASRERWTRLRSLGRRVSLAVVLAGANVGVNAAAVLGQVLALVLGLGWTWWAAVPLALVVESVAVNVGYFAHDKLIKGYSAFWLRLLSYGIGAAVGLFNYSHNAGIEATSAFAGVFGACSLLSPVLWQIYSQWRHWEGMRSQGLLEARAPRFPWARRVLWPGETLFIYRRAVRHGVQGVTEADARFRPEYERIRAARAARRAKAADVPDRADFARLAHETRELSDLLDLRADLTRLRDDVQNSVANLAMVAAVTSGRRVYPVANGDRSRDRTATGSATAVATIIPTPRPRLAINPGNPRSVGHLVPFMTWSRPDPRPIDDHFPLPPRDSGTVADSEAGQDSDATSSRLDGDHSGDRKPPTDEDKRKARQSINLRVKRWGKPLPSKAELAAQYKSSDTWAWSRIQEVKQALLAEGWTFAQDGTPVAPPVAELVASATAPETA